MTRPVLVLRPQPGNARTVARLRAAGLEALALPLFETVPLAWRPPDPTRHDALLVTSANAVRHAGAGLATLAMLPVVAVGPESAQAARAAGLRVVLTGDRDAAALVAQARDAGFARLLHLAGRDHVATGATVVPVYASVAQAPVVPPPGRSIALLHSRRAAEALAALVAPPDRAGIALIAISDAALAGAGSGWNCAIAAPEPSDTAMIALARTLVLPRD